MSQPNNILSVEECSAILQRWQKDGLTEEERNDFVTKASRLAIDLGTVNEFADAVKQRANLAKDVDDAFAELESLDPEWGAFRERYRSCLRLSIKMAGGTANILARFDTVYLVQVLNIQTDEDRLNASAALESLVVTLENDNQSAELSRQYLDLKRDIQYFLNPFSASVEKNTIPLLTSDIEALDAQITAAHKSIGVLGENETLRALGVGAKASNVIASLQYHREKKADTLRNIHRALAVITKLAAPPVETSSKDRSSQPDIDILMFILGMFTDVWAYVRNQSVEFYSILKDGLNAATNTGFKKHVELAREISKPLAAALIGYGRALVSWLGVDSPTGI